MKKLNVIIYRHNNGKRYGYALKVKEKQIEQLFEIFGECEIYIGKYKITKLK